MSMMFFHFLKIIFDISTSKRFKIFGKAAAAAFPNIVLGVIAVAVVVAVVF